MTEDFWSNIPLEQRALLTDPALLYKVKCELDRSITGEDKNKLLLWLVANSSYTKTMGNAWNLSAIVTGNSSSGKSWLVNNVLQYFSNVEDFTRITGASPDRLSQDFTNKILHVEELRGTEPAQATLRVWISEGHLKLLTTDRDEKGHIITRTLETKGFPTFITSATEVEIDSELLNRILILSMDESLKQTRNVLLFEAKIYRELGVSNGFSPNPAFKDLGLHLQHITHVIIPYIELLAQKFPIPPGKEISVGPRRDFKKMIFLIGVIAWLHQLQRTIVQRGPHVFVVATVADFFMAWRLLDESLKNTLLKLTERHKWVLDCFKDSTKSLTVKDVATETELSESRAREILNSLVKKGYLSKDESQKTHLYSLKQKVDLDVTIDDFVTSLSSFEETELEKWLSEQNYKILLAREGPQVIVDPLTGEQFTVNPSTRANTILLKMLKRQDLSLNLQEKFENVTISAIATSPSFISLHLVDGGLYPTEKCSLCGKQPVYAQINYPDGSWGLLCGDCYWKKLKEKQGETEK
ncbi:MAG: helix-turn-helix domain-containing protein [Candidatus Bathyarchaeia archaeon]